MIVVTINKEKYRYDIHAIFKSFFPEEEINVYIKGTRDDKSDEGKISADIFVGDDEGYMEMTLVSADGSIKHEKKECLTRAEVEKRLNPDVALSTSGENDSAIVPRNVLKKLIYVLLSEETGKQLPWGNLTGIRPTGIPMNMMNEGKSDEEIAAFMKSVYYVSDEKIDLGIEIARRELDILKDIDYKDGYSMYIGIPFCPTTCLYCSFTSYPIFSFRDKVDRYLDCIEKELDYVAEAFKDKKLNTIYVGGGTPTTLEPEQMDRLLTMVENKLDLSNLKELTVESGRPDSITVDKLRAMKKHNVTRISVNPQTMRDKTLKFIGRQHTVAQLIDAYNMARAEGFDNINMDIILGLPGETEDDVRYTMEEIMKLDPDDLTVHSLAIKRASRLREWIEQNGLSTINNTESMMEIAREYADKMNLKPYYLYRQKNMAGNYENTGYARDGAAGIYNILIMEEVQSIVALGAGTVTKRVYVDETTGERTGRIERCDNVKDIDLYMDKIDEMIDRKRKLFGDEK